MKVLTVVGARPQFIKVAAVSPRLRERHHEVLVHTGQHYDDAMSGSFFEDLELAPPDVNLNVGGGTHAAMTAEMMRGLERVILENEPDAILTYGDTNSTLAAAVVGAKVAYPDGRRPWLAHVEAGLRSYNDAMPEEHNRVVTDHLSHLLLAPTETAVRNLEREGLGDRGRLVGDVMVDSLIWAVERPPGRLPAGVPAAGEYVLLTLHRPVNVDDPARLASWLDALAGAQPVVFPVHPRTRATIERAALRLPENVIPLNPIGYLAMVALERRARVIVTDSGGVQKEAYLVGVPCVTLRTETEWGETVETGWNRLVGSSTDALLGALDDAALLNRERERPPIFGDGHAGRRVVDAMEEYAA